MSKGRLEAFSDGVIAILITIMVIEMHAPRGSDPGALRPLLPVISSYVMSFLHLAIYWNNHHHLLQAIRVVDGRVLWANVHLLFWLSLVPFVTAWMGQNDFASWPVAMYGIVLLCAAIAYFLLTRALVALHGADSTVAQALGRDFKGKLSIAMYVAAVALSFVLPWIGVALYVSVAVMWLVPDRRIERTLARS